MAKQFVAQTYKNADQQERLTVYMARETAEHLLVALVAQQSGDLVTSDDTDLLEGLAVALKAQLAQEVTA